MNVKIVQGLDVVARGARIGTRRVFARPAFRARKADACRTLRHKRQDWNTRQGDVCDVSFVPLGPVDFVAGGPPSLSFSMGGEARGIATRATCFPGRFAPCGRSGPALSCSKTCAVSCGRPRPLGLCRVLPAAQASWGFSSPKKSRAGRIKILPNQISCQETECLQIGRPALFPGSFPLRFECCSSWSKGC